MAKKPKPTGCCPIFDPKPWDKKTLVWKDKLFIKDSVFCLLHIPLNMGKVITRMMHKIKAAKAEVPLKDFILLSRDISPFESEQYINVSKEVPNVENIKISGTLMVKVYEGPYRKAKKWYYDMIKYVESKGEKAKKIYFYYTTCPKCYKAYGKNYVVVLAQIK
ncbi:hydrolase [Patescibacteria group bacterium]